MNKINKITILNIKMEGFKGFADSFETQMDTLTYIAGGNGQGKTTIADAISFAFCGTPFWGEHSADRLQNRECKGMAVEIRFVDENGEIHTLIRRRNGSNTTITLDTNQLRQADMQTIFAEKDVFLSLINPLYFIEKIAEDGREFLQKLLPVVNENDILTGLSDSTKSLLDGESLLDPEFYIKKKREELKELTENETYYTGQIDALKNQQREAAAKIDSVLERGKDIVARKKALEEKQYSGIDVESLRKQQSQVAQNISDDKRANLLAKKAEIESRQYHSQFLGEISKVQAEYNALLTQYQSKAAEAQKITVGSTCPTCHTVVTEKNYGCIIAEFKKEIEAIRQKGIGMKTSYTELVELEKKSKAKFLEFKADDLKKVESELAALGSTDVSEIAMLEDKIRLGNLTEEEFSALEELKRQADDFEKEVKLLSQTEEIPAKIAEIEKALKVNESAKIKINNLIHAVGEFAAKKAEIVLSKLKMNHAAIKLFDVVKTTGEIKNIFRFTYDGKDYRWLSTSEKVKAGLEVSKLLQGLTGLSFPVYIDNAECITTKLEPIDSQVILAYAKPCELTVKMPRKAEVQRQEAA